VREERKKVYLRMVDSGDIRNTLYPDWVDKNFGTEQSVVDLYNHMVKAGWYTKDVKSFFAKFACDLYSNGQYCQGVTPNTPNTPSTPTNTASSNTVDDTQVNATFSCVNGAQILKGITKSLSGSDGLIYKLSTGGELQFKTDKSFIYVSRNDPNRKINGTWDCNGATEFIVNTENGARLDSKVGYWQYDVVQKSATTPSSSSPSSFSGKIKMGDKGQQVTEIQNLLIKNGYKNISKDGTADGVFGSRTSGAVKDFQSANKDSKGNPLKVDGIVGNATMEALKRKTLKENIIKKVLERNLEMKNK
jgi:hypothetical protein